PTAEELAKMEALLEKAMQEGYPGFSTDGLPFHYLANQPNTRKQIPTQFATFKELKRLTAVLRKHNRVWQATPPKDSPPKTVRNFLLTSGRLYKKPLKVTATAAIDLHTNSGIAKLGMILTRLLNSWLIKGHFRFQALSAKFRVWADGVITPVAEEIPELRVLNELDLDDREGRLRILNDPAWLVEFRKMWFKGKRGFNLDVIKRWLNREDNVLNRRLDDMTFSDCPMAHWNGQSMQKPFERLVQWQKTGGKEGAVNQEEAELFKKLKNPIVDDAEFFLEMLRHWDLECRWETAVANRDPEMTKKLLFHPLTLPGFNDSGAHLTNLAFYDGNLRTLKIAQGEGMDWVASAVHRLTQAPAEFFGLNTGVLKVGAQADIVVVDPQALRQWEPENTYKVIWRDLFSSKQVVNRPEGVVTQVMIGGHMAWSEGEFTERLGQMPFGRLMRAQDHPAEISRQSGLSQNIQKSQATAKAA
ncbi:MAG: amidohydrolase family protein, partial [Limnobacter sp.]|nr:amidohydrolase family protein [Limnobacter sp.]